MNKKEKLSLKDLTAILFVLATAIFVLPIHALLRKLKGEPYAVTRLVLRSEELDLLQQASNNRVPVSINDKKIFLQVFNLEKHHIHPSCGTCPDELCLDDTEGRACLSATREQGDSQWSVHAMTPVLWGLFGYVGTDLQSLHVNGKSLGKA
jgi:hypothetical protein